MTLTLIATLIDPGAIFEGLVSNAVWAVIGATLAWVWYRRRITDKDLIIHGLEAQLQEALRKHASLSSEHNQQKFRLEALETARPEAALARFEKETNEQNFTRGAYELMEWFEQERRTIAAAIGEIGEWYLGFTADVDGEAALHRAQRFMALAMLLEPEKPRWTRAAEELDVRMVIDAVKSSRSGWVEGGFDEAYSATIWVRTARQSG